MIPALEFFHKGGLLIYPILLCSLIGTTIFFHLLLRYRTARDRNGIGNKLLNLLNQQKLAEARSLLQSRLRQGKRQPTSAVEILIAEALNVRAEDRHTLELVLGHSIERQINDLGRFLGILSTMGNITPLLGLLGTVVGMIKAFMVVESLGGRVNASVLAGGIWEAMLTTGFGLGVAIPLLVFHSYLEGKINLIQSELERVAVWLLTISVPQRQGVKDNVEISGTEKNTAGHTPDRPH